MAGIPTFPTTTPRELMRDVKSELKAGQCKASSLPEGAKQIDKLGGRTLFDAGGISLYLKQKNGDVFACDRPLMERATPASNAINSAAGAAPKGTKVE